MKKLSSKDIIWSYLGQIANLTVHIILTPLIAVKLTASELGLWYTFTSIYTFITFFDTSFSPLILKNATYCISGAKKLSKEGVDIQNVGEPNYELLHQLVRAAQRIYRIVAVIFLVLLLIVGSPYIMYITKGKIDISCLGAWVIYALGIGINFYIIYLPSVLKGIGYIASSQKVFVISRSVQLLISIIGVMSGGGLYALSAGFFVGSLLIFILSRRVAKSIDFLKFKEKEDGTKAKEIINIIWFNAKKMALVTMGRYFSTQGGILICSTFVSLEMSGAYGLTMQALQAVASIANIYLQTLIPSISSASIRNQKRERKESFAVGMCVFWILYPVGIVTVGIVCNPLLRLLHANTMLLDMRPFFVLAVGYFMLSNYVNFNIINESQNCIPHVKAEFIFGIGNICGLILISNFGDFGIWGIIFVQTLMPLFYNAWHWPYQVLKILDTDLKEMVCMGMNKIKRMLCSNKI